MSSCKKDHNAHISVNLLGVLFCLLVVDLSTTCAANSFPVFTFGLTKAYPVALLKWPNNKIDNTVALLMSFTTDIYHRNIWHLPGHKTLRIRHKKGIDVRFNVAVMYVPR